MKPIDHAFIQFVDPTQDAQTVDFVNERLKFSKPVTLIYDNNIDWCNGCYR